MVSFLLACSMASKQWTWFRREVYAEGMVTEGSNLLFSINNDEGKIKQW